MVRCLAAWLGLLVRGGGVEALPGRSTGGLLVGSAGSSKSATCCPACPQSTTHPYVMRYITP